MTNHQAPMIKLLNLFGYWNLIIDDYLVIVIWLLVFGIY